MRQWHGKQMQRNREEHRLQCVKYADGLELLFALLVIAFVIFVFWWSSVLKWVALVIIDVLRSQIEEISGSLYNATVHAVSIMDENREKGLNQTVNRTEPKGEQEGTEPKGEQDIKELLIALGVLHAAYTCATGVCSWVWSLGVGNVYCALRAKWKWQGEGFSDQLSVTMNLFDIEGRKQFLKMRTMGTWQIKDVFPEPHVLNSLLPAATDAVPEPLHHPDDPSSQSSRVVKLFNDLRAAWRILMNRGICFRASSSCGAAAATTMAARTTRRRF